MPSYSDARLDRLELALRRMEERALRAEAKLDQLDQRQRMQAAQAGFAAPSGGGLRVGTVSAAIAGGASGMVDLCNSSGGWAPSGGSVAVVNPDPVASLYAGQRVAVQADQSGTVLATPLQC
ncbi:MAG: hypothetical protein BGO49_04325 [Planctomycetales bacterium 71-10]|nr:MAG: hypothetical protein BGO49_04325 [Planctomycetales bacterium 71-10]